MRWAFYPSPGPSGPSSGSSAAGLQGWESPNFQSLKHGSPPFTPNRMVSMGK